jgi:DNA-binding XRE family transcriptional regulator
VREFDIIEARLAVSGAEIKAVRERHGISLQDLAWRVGISVQTLEAIEADSVVGPKKDNVMLWLGSVPGSNASLH